MSAVDGSRSGRQTAPGRLTFETGPVERRGLRDHVYDNLLELLLRGDVPPGTRLPIEALARELGVSPTPVREALVHLERTDLVTREAQKGYRMAPPLGREQLAELFGAREMLERTAARLAAPNAERLLPELREAQEAHRLAGEAVIGSLGEGRTDVALSADYFARDRQFHDVVLAHSGNRYLLRMSADLGALLHRLRVSVHRGVNDVREAIAEHAAVVEAFAGPAPLTAEQAMAAHIDNVRTRALRDEETARG